MSDQVFNELKNVGKINYQALEELRSIKNLMEKNASILENIALTNDKIVNLLLEAKAFSTPANNVRPT